MRPIAIVSLAARAGAEGPAAQPGVWDLTSKAAELVIPGTSGVLLRMMRGKSTIDHKCIAPDQAKAGLAAVLAPDPKAQCTVPSPQLSASRFDQVMTCPDKQGGALRVGRTHIYSAQGFTARMTIIRQPPGCLSAASANLSRASRTR